METVQIVLLLIFNLVFYGTVLIYLPYYLAKRKGRVKWSHLFGQVCGLAKM